MPSNPLLQLPYQFPAIPSSQKYFCYPPSVVPNSSHQDICVRRRRGRGGRIIFDRCHFNFQQRQAADRLPGWVEGNFPASDEFDAM